MKYQRRAAYAEAYSFETLKLLLANAGITKMEFQGGSLEDFGKYVQVTRPLGNYQISVREDMLLVLPGNDLWYATWPIHFERDWEPAKEAA